MSSLDMTSFDAALKQHYTNDEIMRMTYKDHPFLALVPKMTDFGGKNLPIPIIYGNPQGRSASFTYAKANKVSGKYTDFVLTRSKDYGLCSIDNETLEASKGNQNAFMEAATTEIDGTFASLSSSLSSAIFRNGSGSIGQISTTTTIASDTCVLADLNDIVHFEVGQKIVASTADGGGTVKAHGGVQNALTVAGVNRMTGTITFDALMDSFGSNDWAQSDYLFVQGDYDSKIKGLEAWIPATDPTSATFFGVDRSVDTRLGGLRYDVSDRPIEEGLIDLAMLVNREGGKLSHFFVNYNRYGILEKSLGSKVQYIDVNTKVGIAFRGIVLNTPKGPVTVMADTDCQDTVAWGIQMDIWKLYSLGLAPKLLNQDGNKWLRESDADSIELRAGYYAQLGCRAPGWNIRGKIA